MQGLGGVQLDAVPLEVVLLEIQLHQLLLTLASLELEGVPRKQPLLLVVHHQPAEHTAPLHHLLLALHEDYLQGVLVDGVLAHGDEHAQRPGELLPVSQVKGPILLQLLIEGVEDGLQVGDLGSTAVDILNRVGSTLSLMNSAKTPSSMTLNLWSDSRGSPRVILRYFSR
jgi:hypothetical protein